MEQMSDSLSVNISLTNNLIRWKIGYEYGIAKRYRNSIPYTSEFGLKVASCVDINWVCE